jgi:hypothetical protein
MRFLYLFGFQIDFFQAEYSEPLNSKIRQNDPLFKREVGKLNHTSIVFGVNLTCGVKCHCLMSTSN